MIQQLSVLNPGYSTEEIIDNLDEEFYNVFIEYILELQITNTLSRLEKGILNFKRNRANYYAKKKIEQKLKQNNKNVFLKSLQNYLKNYVNPEISSNNEIDIHLLEQDSPSIFDIIQLSDEHTDFSDKIKNLEQRVRTEKLEPNKMTDLVTEGNAIQSSSIEKVHPVESITQITEFTNPLKIMQTKRPISTEISVIPKEYKKLQKLFSDQLTDINQRSQKYKESLQELAQLIPIEYLIKFNYYFFPEVHNSDFVPMEINSISELDLRNTIFLFLDLLDIELFFDFFYEKIDFITKLNLLEKTSQNHLQQIYYNFLDFKSNNYQIFENTKRNFQYLQKNVKDINFLKIVDRVFYILLRNQEFLMDKTIRKEFLIKLLKYDPDTKDNTFEDLLDCISQLDIISTTF